MRLWYLFRCSSTTFRQIHLYTVLKTILAGYVSQRCSVYGSCINWFLSLVYTNNLTLCANFFPQSSHKNILAAVRVRTCVYAVRLLFCENFFPQFSHECEFSPWQVFLSIWAVGSVTDASDGGSDLLLHTLSHVWISSPLQQVFLWFSIALKLIWFLLELKRDFPRTCQKHWLTPRKYPSHHADPTVYIQNKASRTIAYISCVPVLSYADSFSWVPLLMPKLKRGQKPIRKQRGIGCIQFMISCTGCDTVLLAELVAMMKYM